MKTYQPNNGPIKFVVVNSEYNDDHAYNKTIIDVLYTTKRYELVDQNDVSTKTNQDADIPIGLLAIESDTPRHINDPSKITWSLLIDKTPHNTSLRSPYYVTKHTTIGNTDADFNEMLDGIAEKIVQYYKNTKMEQPEKDIGTVKENEYNQEDVTKLPDTLRKRIKINNIIYNLDGVPNQSPTPIYEIEVDLSYINVYPHIQSVLLNVYVCYDGASQKFHAKVETVQLNGVHITDLQLDDAMFQELSSIYMHDALKRIDFTSAIENHLRMLNSRLDLCHKILNSNLDS